jgi:HemX protein
MELHAHIDRLLFGIATLIYGLVFLLGVYFLRARKQYPLSLLIPLLAVGFAIQTLALNIRGIQLQACPLGNPFEISQFVIWSLVLLYFIVGPALRLRLLGFFTAALASIIGSIFFALPHLDSVHGGGIFGGNPLIELHAALAAFSYGIFGLLALFATMFLIQQYGLRHKLVGGVYRILPSLHQLSQIIHRTLLVGLLFLSAALFVGYLFWSRDADIPMLFKLVFVSLLWLGYLLSALRIYAHKSLSRRNAFVLITLFVGLLLSLWPVEMARKRQVDNNFMLPLYCSMPQYDICYPHA